MAISAVCVYGIPKGETRRIDMIGVFAVTASFSIFAYLWLLIVLKASSPDVIEIWEAVLTLIYFPVLVLVAYAADKRWIQGLFCKKGDQSAVPDKQRQIELGTLQPGETEEMLQTKDYFRNGQLDKEGLVNFIKDVKKNTKRSDEDAAVLAASK
jgi:solute carrier family 8 (sodium/calcium exchanger)